MSRQDIEGAVKMCERQAKTDIFTGDVVLPRTHWNLLRDYVLASDRLIPLSLMTTLARAHGGTYTRGPSRWPMTVPFAVERSSHGVDCSSLSAFVVVESARCLGLLQGAYDLDRHKAWLIRTGDRYGPLTVCRELGLEARAPTAVTICQGWIDEKNPKLGGHTWLEVDRGGEKFVLDATPDGPWLGVRILAPRPSWRWRHVKSLYLPVYDDG